MKPNLEPLRALLFDLEGFFIYLFAHFTFALTPHFKLSNIFCNIL